MSSADESCKKLAKMIISSSIHRQPLPKQTFIVTLNKFSVLCFSLILRTIHRPVRDTLPTQVSRMSYDSAINDP